MIALVGLLGVWLLIHLIHAEQERQAIRRDLDALRWYVMQIREETPR